MEDINKFIEKKEFSKALDLLNREQQQLEAGVYFYNLGLIKIHQGEYPQARLNFEKAMGEGLNHKFLDHNLQKVKQELGVLRLEEIDSYMGLWIEQNLKLPQSFLFAFVLISALFLLIIRKHISRMILFFLFSFLGMFIVENLWIKSEYSLAISLGEAQVFEGPSNAMEKVHVLPEGMRVLVKRKDQIPWFQLSYPKDFQGWVPKSQLTLY